MKRRREGRVRKSSIENRIRNRREGKGRGREREGEGRRVDANVR